MLFYSLPILCIFLPPDYTHHLSLLVSSMHMLLSDDLKVSDLDCAHTMLCTFYQTAGDLYSPNIYTANMHSLQHTVPLARLWGPLWVYSMFGFENLNGYIGSMFHGTQKIVYLMSFQIQLRQTIPYKLRELSRTKSPSTQEYLKGLLERRRHNMLEIKKSCYAIGKISSSVLTPVEAGTVAACGVTLNGDPKVQSFHCLMLHNTIYHSSSYSRSTCQDNSICSYLKADGTRGYGQIKSFYLSPSTDPFCLIEPYIPSGGSLFHRLRPARNKKIREQLP